jgi:hypothetical protein
MIAALYVMTDGPYFGLEGVDPWDVRRDARLYAGPHPVVAHPPCERWGRYWSGGPSARVRRQKGDDGGCFAAALHAVRQYGGVLEHPEASHAWDHFGIIRPPREGGWVRSMFDGGWTCCVEQGHYGHPARKATWLYAVTARRPPELRWGSSGRRARLDAGYHSREERARGGRQVGRRLTKRENTATPIAFRNLLLNMAALCFDADYPRAWGEDD